MGKNDGSEEGITHTEREQSGASPVCSFAEAPRRQTEPLARFGGVVCSLAPAPLQARVCMFQPRRWSHPKGQKRQNRASGRPLGEVSPLRNHSPKPSSQPSQAFPSQPRGRRTRLRAGRTGGSVLSKAVLAGAGCILTWSAPSAQSRSLGCWKLMQKRLP